MGQPVQPSYTQTRFRFRNDDGTQATATWKATENTSITQAVNQVFRLRIQVAQTVTNANRNLSKIFKVRFSRNSGAYTDVAAIDATTAGVRYASSANVSDGTATTSQLTAASGTFLAGVIDNNNTTGTLTFNIQQYTDLEFVLELYGPQLTANDTLDFRVYETDNTVLNTYTQTARATAVFTLAPNAPILSTPANEAEIDGASQQTFTWQFSSDEPGDSQTAFAFARDRAMVVDGTTPTLVGTGYGCAFSPDGTLLAIAHSVSPFLTVLNTSDWSVVSGTPTLAGTGWYCTFSPNGNFLALAHFTSPVLTVLNTSDWSVVSGTPTLAGSAYYLDFNHTGTLLAIAHSVSPFLTVLNTSDWSVVSGTFVPASPSDVGYSCTFNPAGTLLAFGHFYGTRLTISNTSDWSVVTTPTISSAVWACDFSPDGTLLAAALQNSPFLTVLNTSDWSEVSGTPTLAGHARGCTFSHDGALLVVTHSNTPFLTVLNTSDWSVVSGTPTLAGIGVTCPFSPDNTLLAIAHHNTPFLTVTTAPKLPQYWNGTSWQASEVFVNSTTQGVTFPADSWSDT